MRTVIISARYFDNPELEQFFLQTFGPNVAEVRWARGKYQCTIPRLLRSDEIESLKQVVEVEHYQELPNMNGR